MGRRDTTSWWATPEAQQDRHAFFAQVRSRDDDRQRRSDSYGAVPWHRHQLTRKQRARLAAHEE